MADKDPSEKSKGLSHYDGLLGRIGVVATVAALIFAVYTYLKTQGVRGLQLSYDNSFTLVSPELRDSERVKVIFADKEIKNLSRMQFVYTNSGNVPIKRDEIESPLSLKFQKSKVLTAEIALKSPKNIDADISFSDQTVTITHGLLNPGDSIRVTLLCDGEIEYPSPTMRLVGLSEINAIYPTGNPPRAYSLIWPAAARPWEIFVLGIMSVIPVTLLVVAVGLSYDYAKFITTSRLTLLDRAIQSLHSESVLSDAFRMLTFQHSNTGKFWVTDESKRATLAKLALEGHDRFKETILACCPDGARITDAEMNDFMAHCIKHIRSQICSAMIDVSASHGFGKSREQIENIVKQREFRANMNFEDLKRNLESDFRAKVKLGLLSRIFSVSLSDVVGIVILLLFTTICVSLLVGNWIIVMRN